MSFGTVPLNEVRMFFRIITRSAMPFSSGSGSSRPSTTIAPESPPKTCHSA